MENTKKTVSISSFYLLKIAFLMKNNHDIRHQRAKVHQKIHCSL